MKNTTVRRVSPIRCSSIDMQANVFFNEYYELTGKEYPPCDQNRWNSLDDWFVDLKLAVYREQANLEVYGKNQRVIPQKTVSVCSSIAG